MAAIPINIADWVGRTPMVQLTRLLPDAPAAIFAKLEMLNPGGSVKDRIGVAMIEAAEAEGRIEPGRTTIVEATSGNTGIALAFVCAAKGYDLVLTLPQGMSREREGLLRLYGAQVHVTESLGGMDEAVAAAQALARGDDFWLPDQFTNPANPDAHYRSTGPELWEALDGDVDVLVAGIGTGGTITGAGGFLKERNPGLEVVGVEPASSPVISGGRPGPHKIQGIGAGLRPARARPRPARRGDLGRRRGRAGDRAARRPPRGRADGDLGRRGAVGRHAGGRARGGADRRRAARLGRALRLDALLRPRAGGRRPPMTLREAPGPAGPPWERPLRGTLDRLVVESERLAGNPLGDPATRPLWVYRAPGAGDDPVPTVYVIMGFLGQVDMWTNRFPFEATMIERVDELFASGDCPPATLVFVDAWTTWGGSQFLNSAGTGQYLDYLCDEVVPFVDGRYPTLPGAAHRGLTGKSSGGYGAMVVPMLRPDVFGALASHAGDALFECCYLPNFPQLARKLRDDFDGSIERFWDELQASGRLDMERFENFDILGYAAAYSPDPERPGKPLLPFEVETGRLIDDVWEQWLDWDPVRMAPRHADALRSMRRVYLDAGKADEWFLDLGAQAFGAELDKLGVEYSLELFDGKHGGITYRYPGAIRELVLALR